MKDLEPIGHTFDNRWAMTFTVRDGKITKFEEYADTQALAAHPPITSTQCNRLGMTFDYSSISKWTIDIFGLQTASKVEPSRFTSF